MVTPERSAKGLGSRIPLRVAEQYVEKLGLLAKENDTMIVATTAVTCLRSSPKPRTPYDPGRRHPVLGSSRLRSPSSRIQ